VSEIEGISDHLGILPHPEGRGLPRRLVNWIADDTLVTGPGQEQASE